ncbi:hypothetical protein GCM10010502_68620 [Kitasatospora aureofaciens]|uniref:Uncharacterized protein n=1 Tax=Kitasatospora aureofaciens TaxID=1894 RepID=A0A8H9HYX1_KITAU|nr:hypothetical protein GCM10010502_68620 [Kitasatospora aureofaciens]
MRVIGAITMRLGTVSPLILTGRERISVVRETEGSVTVMGIPRGWRAVDCAGTKTVARANHLDGPRISPTARLLP